MCCDFPLLSPLFCSRFALFLIWCGAMLGCICSFKKIHLIHPYKFNVYSGLYLSQQGSVFKHKCVYLYRGRKTNTQAHIRTHSLRSAKRKRLNEQTNCYKKQNSSKMVLFPFRFVSFCYHIEYTLSPLHRADTDTYSSTLKNTH